MITILGILAVVAAPRFLSLSDDAEQAKLEAMEGTLKSGIQLFHTKAQIEGLTNGNQTLTIDNVQIPFNNGYPISNWNRAVRYVLHLDHVEYSPQANTICKSDWCGRGDQTSLPSGISANPGRATKVFPRGYSWNDQCGVYYINRLNGTQPQIGIENNGC